MPFNEEVDKSLALCESVQALCKENTHGRRLTAKNKELLSSISALVEQCECLKQVADSYLRRSYGAWQSCDLGSQFGEDEVLERLLPKENGTYIDIGAGDPMECNNTWKFYERGWRGLLIEPLFWYWPKILHCRPGDLLYDSAVRNYDGYTLLYVHGMLSSVIQGWTKDVDGGLIIPCETTQSILKKFPTIRDECTLCSIDVEGVEKEVLESNDWSLFRPEVFVIEYCSFNPSGPGLDMIDGWLPILQEAGYVEVARNALNAIFQLRKE